MFTPIPRSHQSPVGIFRRESLRGTHPAWCLRLPILPWRGKVYDIANDGWTVGWHDLNILFSIERHSSCIDIRIGWGWVARDSAKRISRWGA